MCRRLTIAGLSLALFLLAFGRANAAAPELSALRTCKRIFSYSGKENAYFFGFEDAALTSARVLPDRITRTVRVSGSIITACHDEYCAYVLYRATGGFRVTGMRMSDGVCTDIAVGDGYEVQASSFAAAGGEAFVIAVTGGVSFVAGTDGKSRAVYRFDSNIDRLFVSNNRAFARLDNGSVYVLGGGSSVRQNASSSVAEGFSADGTLTACTDTQTAVLRCDFVCLLPDSEPVQPAQPSGGTVLTADSYVQVTAGTTVAALKKACANLTVVYNETGSEASGVLRTGYSALVSGKAYPVAVTGDLDGSGTVSSRDVTALMDCFVGSGSLTACCAKAADVNGDGVVNNRDLVLLVRGI